MRFWVRSCYNLTMTVDRKKLGAWGESVAATHLEANGYMIVARNWRSRIGEIDLVAQKGAALAFVEVKTRRGRSHGTPEDAITPRKAQKLMQTVQSYLSENDCDEDLDFSIDVVAVELDRGGKVLRIEHLVNAVSEW